MLRQDLRFALRTLSKSPGFTAVAVVILGIGIGANTMAFTFANGLLLRPFPYPEPERLFEVYTTWIEGGRRARSTMSYPDLLDHRAQEGAFAGIAGVSSRPFNFRAADEPLYLNGAWATANLFDVLGVDPIIGRDFRADEEGPAAEPVVVLAETLWRERFNADPDVVGRTIMLNGEVHTVVGVVPYGTGYPDSARLWTPFRLDPARQSRGNHWIEGIGRLAAGVSPEQALAASRVLSRRLAEQYPETNEAAELEIVPLRVGRTSGSEQMLFVLLGAVTFVLLIACANVVNLVLARAAAREGELAVRVALGAGRSRLLRQLLTESGVLALGGGLLGVLIARWSVSAVIGAAPVPPPEWIHLGIDHRVLSFVTGSTTLAITVFGLAPALQATRRDLVQPLKSAAAGGGPGARRQRARSVLIVAEVALTVVLLVGAGLMVSSFLNLASVDPGFDTSSGFIMSTMLPEAQYPSGTERLAFYEQVKARLGALPGVEAVGAVTQFPLLHGWSRTTFMLEGQSEADYESNPWILHHVASVGYAEAAGLRLLAGRTFREADVTDDATPVVMVNARVARTFWPGDSPIGRRLRFGGPDDGGAWRQIVGVVGDVKQRELDLDTGLEVYVPYETRPGSHSRITWVVRTVAEPGSLIGAARAEVQAVDPDQAVYDAMTVAAAVDASVWPERIFTVLMWIFGGLALLLSSVGVYGLMGYTVARRAREIGIRMAMGARRRDVVSLVLRGGMRLVILGAVIGLGAAAALGRFLTGVLYEVDPGDPLVFVAVSALLVGVGGLAALLPARRATRVDPVTALRAE